MALSILQTDAIGRLIKPGMKVISFGYPDIIAPQKMIEGIVKGKELKYREDSQKICSRHGLQPQEIPDSQSFFEALGAKLVVYDVVQERGGEIIADLNRPQAIERGDIVLDVGTAEHCFNIGRALINMAGAVKEGGVIIHENPSNWGNHGFYNLNPTLFHDFYTQNGFEIEELELVNRTHEIKVPPYKRFKFDGQEWNIFCIAKRMRLQTFQYPVQAKYRGLIPPPGISGEKEIVNG